MHEWSYCSSNKKAKKNKTLTYKETSLQDPIPTEIIDTITEAWVSTLIIGEGGIIWLKEKIEASGIWKVVHLTNVFGFKRKVKCGEKILVIPLNKKLAPRNLKIKAITKVPADEVGDTWYVIEFKNIAHKSSWKAQAPEGNSEQYPSSVICIYPVIEKAQLLRAKEYENQFDLIQAILLFFNFNHCIMERFNL